MIINLMLFVPTRLKDSLESALSGGREQASEVTQLQEDLRVALDALQV